MIRWSNADLEQMKAIERTVVKTLLPFRSRTEAALVVFALVRCARTLLNLYPVQRRKELTRVIVDFLENRNSPRDAPEESAIILPPEFSHTMQ